jgi:hypothetical protein
VIQLFSSDTLVYVRIDIYTAINLLFIFHIYYIFIRGGTQGRYIGHYKVGTDSCKQLKLRDKEWQRVPLGFPPQISVRGCATGPPE